MIVPAIPDDTDAFYRSLSNVRQFNRLQRPANVLSRSISSARLRVSLIVACGIAAERLAFTAGFEAVVEDEGTSLDASRSNSDTLPLVSLRLFTYDKSKSKHGRR